MYWSYSSNKVFKRCPRRWYFDNSVVNYNPKAKDPVRREAFLLSQLQSIDAWRGSVVDEVIKRKIVLPIEHRQRASRKEVMKYAEELSNAQLEFAFSRSSRIEGMTKSKADDRYAALFDVEYGQQIPVEKIEQAREEIVTALDNLLGNDELMTCLYQADQLLPQRTLFIQEDDFTVKAIPDVIAFYQNQPPLIIDWKVHISGQYDYWLQLACYAIALIRGNPHKDFRVSLSPYSPTDVRLVEAQLLIDRVRWYQLSEEDIDTVDDYIFTTAMEMLLALGDDGNNVLRPLEFRTTSHPDDCLRCPFQKMCGADGLWQA